MIIHELATNAVKHGALSLAADTIEVFWQIRSSGEAELTWREGDGPAIKTRERKGFGLRLCERLARSVKRLYGNDLGAAGGVAKLTWRFAPA
jgi:two-component sensor histidine kinase